MQRKDRIEMKIKIKSGFQEQAPSVAYACDTNILLILGVKGVRK